MTAARLGARAAMAVVAVGIAYAATLAVGFARFGLSHPITHPVLAVMEVLTVASAIPVLAVFVALHAVTDSSRKHWSLLALCFAAMFALATIGVHVVELTAGHQLGVPGLVWPSVPYAVELLAWDLLLGLALVTGARALPADRDTARVRAVLQVTGALCLAGMVGPAVGMMRLQLIGVAGYAVVLPVAAWVLAAWFRAESRREAPGGR